MYPQVRTSWMCPMPEFPGSRRLRPGRAPRFPGAGNPRRLEALRHRVGLVATQDYLQRHGEPREPGELSTHNCLFYPRGTDQPAWTFERGSKHVERLTVPIAGSFATNNSEALRDSALNHLGIALLRTSAPTPRSPAAKLVQVLKDWTLKGAFADEICLIWPYFRHVAQVGDRVLVSSYLKEKLSGGFRYLG